MTELEYMIKNQASKKSLGRPICNHSEAFVEPACCTPGITGRVDCLCAGQDRVLCPAEDCTGMTQRQAYVLYYLLTDRENLEVGYCE